MAARAHDVVVVGAGNGGLSAAALLRRRGCRDVALVEPSLLHVYKPLQNYVGLGLARPAELQRSQAELIPPGVHWYRTSVIRVDPDAATVQCADGRFVTGADVVLAPGAVIDWGSLPGAEHGLRTGRVCTTFEAEQLSRTARMILGLQQGRAMFTVNSQPASGRETAFKPLFLACDSWRRAGALEHIEVVLVNQDQELHPVRAIAAELERHLGRFGVKVKRGTIMAAVDHGDTAVLEGPGGRERMQADLIHVLPPYAAPAFIADSGLDALDTHGFLAVDEKTLRHRHHPSIWGVGDASDLGDARTGGALRRQVTIVVDNIQRARKGMPLVHYDGYTVAPIATARGQLSFGEYDRRFEVRRSFPVPDQIRSRRLWWWLDQYALPQIYWHRILRGRL
jgi:NADPH-dependent 2,4-dienoyl-CoA reductase/sulfur reductase-like enzyme